MVGSDICLFSILQGWGGPSSPGPRAHGVMMNWGHLIFKGLGQPSGSQDCNTSSSDQRALQIPLKYDATSCVHSAGCFFLNPIPHNTTLALSSATPPPRCCASSMSKASCTSIASCADDSAASPSLSDASPSIPVFAELPSSRRVGCSLAPTAVGSGALLGGALLCGALLRGVLLCCIRPSSSSTRGGVRYFSQARKSENWPPMLRQLP